MHDVQVDELLQMHYALDHQEQRQHTEISTIYRHKNCQNLMNYSIIG
jgi:hypothetical protein